MWSFRRGDGGQGAPVHEWFLSTYYVPGTFPVNKTGKVLSSRVDLLVRERQRVNITYEYVGEYLSCAMGKEKKQIRQSR